MKLGHSDHSECGGYSPKDDGEELITMYLLTVN